MIQLLHPCNNYEYAFINWNASLECGLYDAKLLWALFFPYRHKYSYAECVHTPNNNTVLVTIINKFRYKCKPHCKNIKKIHLVVLMGPSYPFYLVRGYYTKYLFIWHNIEYNKTFQKKYFSCLILISTLTT